MTYSFVSTRKRTLMKPVALFLVSSLLICSALFGQSARVASVKLQLISSKLLYPTAFTVAPGGPADRLFVCEQAGRIRIIDRGKAIPALVGKYVVANWIGPIWQREDAGEKPGRAKNSPS
ncbi:MAG: hypothetical protein H7319_14875 [Spirosoma sp.]|nr:hypothetical protein [Spirosoma sp.]